MFKKKNCGKCGRKVSDKNNFCSACGCGIGKSENGDWGMLGKDDSPAEEEFGGIRIPGGFNVIFNSLMKNLDKQFRNLDREMRKGAESARGFSKNGKPRNGIGKGISISISSMGNGPPKISVMSYGNGKTANGKKTKEISLSEFSRDAPKNFSKLPREEPKTGIKRLSDKVVYEIEIPDVKSTKDVLITKLENSIEIKAASEKKSYSKLIPFNLPIINYDFAEGKLVLEMAEN